MITYNILEVKFYKLAIRELYQKMPDGTSFIDTFYARNCSTFGY